MKRPFQNVLDSLITTQDLKQSRRAVTANGNAFIVFAILFFRKMGYNFLWIMECNFSASFMVFKK
jgi:hypothetical protein